MVCICLSIGLLSSSSSLSISIIRVVLCLPLEEDYEAYMDLLPAYFPRTEEEESQAVMLLPEHNGDEWGSLIMRERYVLCVCVSCT